MTGIFLFVMLTLAMLPIFRHLPAPHEHHAGKPGIGYSVAAAVMWVLWMWMIYRRWQIEKTQVEA
jgi:hypothetical protein